MILIIAEKDSQANNIADALNLLKRTISVEIKKGIKEEIKYYGGTYDSNDIILLGTGGHLLELRGRSSEILYFGFTWKPPTQRSKDKLAKYKFIKEKVKTATEIIVATDSDEEGELIGYNLVNTLKVLSKATRMMFISMTEKAVIKAFNERGPLRINIAKGAEIRTWMDKVFGYIFSKYLTQAYCSVTGAQYLQLPVGRVMTPALSFIIENMLKIEQEKKIRAEHEPKVIYRFELKVNLPNINTGLDKELLEIDDNQYRLTHKELNRLIWKYKNLKGKIIDISTKNYYIRAPNSGFTIDEIVSWAYKKGIDYERTIVILQVLYINKLISYPRSESTILPEDEEYHSDILKNCLDFLKLNNKEEIIQRKIPNMGKESDGAHYAIHPTEKKAGKLPPDYELIYDHIVKTYVKGFCKNKTFWEHQYTVQFKVIPFEKRFTIDYYNEEGYQEEYEKTAPYWKTIEDYGYEVVDSPSLLDYEPPERDYAPNLRKGQIVSTEMIIEQSLDFPFVSSPKNKDDLLEYMKKSSLGTDATRYNIVGKLWDINMVRENKPVIPTVLGMKVYEAIMDLNPKLTRTELTQEFEEKRKNVEKGELTINEVKESVISIISELINDRVNDLENIGVRLAFFGECLKCGSRMKLVSWNKNGNFLFFLACESEECDFTSPI